MRDKKNELVPVFGSSQRLDKKLLEDISESLNGSSAVKTFNAWQSASLVDGIGQVWLKVDFLSAIWRTDAGTAQFFVGSINSHDKATFNGQDCIKYSAAIYRINEIIQGPVSHKRREYLRFSEKIGQSVRDSDPVEVIRFKHREFIDNVRRELKKNRRQKYSINNDELTGELLYHSESEFHHIRRQSAHPELISMLWNGLLVNKNTHTIITSKNCSDEYDLKNLCDQLNWSTSWFSNYQQELSQAGYE